LRQQLLTIIGLLVTLTGFSQPFGSYFHSRLEFALLSPEIIKNNKITRVRISDHFMKEISFNYEFQYNTEGILTACRSFFNPNLNKSEICNLDPADTIFYNRTGIEVINENNRTTRIKYDQKGRIKMVNYSHNQIIIGCPIRSLIFEYNSSGRISKETMINCTDSLVSKYVYRRKLVKEIICTNFRKNERFPCSAVETINERFNVNYDSPGLIKSIIKSTDPEVFVSYEYFK
jgi:YD repeat-containing protein